LDEAQVDFCDGAKPKARHHRFALFGTFIDGHPNFESSEVAARRRSGMRILQGWERHESLVGVCIVYRKLQIFDSFDGLPEPGEGDQEHVLLRLQTVHSYKQGAWCGTFSEVQRNIDRYGRLSSCNLNPGYFEDSLPEFKTPCVLVFADVDLTRSLETCLRYLWPLLQDGCCFFTHEAQHAEISSLFFDRTWWHSNLSCSAPGLIGAGTGIGLLPAAGGFKSDLAYTVKNPAVRNFREDPQTGIVR